METTIRDKLVTFLEENIMINNSQHGFRHKRSCLTNLLDFYNDVFNIYDKTKATAKIFKWLENWVFREKTRHCHII